MKQATIFATLAISMSLSAANAQEGAGQSFDVRGFDAVETTASDNVEIREGSRFSVTAHGDPRAVATLAVTVRNGVLRVGRVTGTHSDDGATLVVTMPTVRAARISGSGEVLINSVRGSVFEGRVSGSGNLNIGNLAVEEGQFSVPGSGAIRVGSAQAQRVSLTSAGSGRIDATGRAASAVIESSGSGDIDARSLASTELDIRQAGSGSVSAAASGTARVRANGTGRVTVVGNPRCQVSGSASSRVTCG